MHRNLFLELVRFERSFRFPAMRRCPLGGFRGVESEFEVQNGLQQAPGMKMNEFMRFINFQNLQEKSINPFLVRIPVPNSFFWSL